MKMSEPARAEQTNVLNQVEAAEAQGSSLNWTKQAVRHPTSA